MRMARAFMAAVPLALVLVAAVVVPVALTPGTFGFRSWPASPAAPPRENALVIEQQLPSAGAPTRHGPEPLRVGPPAPARCRSPPSARGIGRPARRRARRTSWWPPPRGRHRTTRLPLARPAAA